MKAKTKRLRPPAQALVKEAPWTLVGPGSVIHGELLMSGNVIVHGRVEGIVFADGEVVVAEGGAVDGGVHARRVTVEGSCEGRVEATEEVIVRRGAVVRGDIEARILTVDPDARFLGKWIRSDKQANLKILPYEKTPGHA